MVANQIMSHLISWNLGTHVQMCAWRHNVEYLSVDFKPNHSFCTVFSYHEDKFSGSLCSPNVDPVYKLSSLLGFPIQFLIA